MSVDFSTLPVRANGQQIDASWFNTIRTFLINALGIVSGEVPQSIGQTDTNQDITALVFDKNEFHKIDIEYFVERLTSTDEVIAAGKLTLQYRTLTNTWDLIEGPIDGDDALISFSKFEDISGGGNIVTVRYSTTTIPGTGHTGKLKTKFKTWGAA